MAGVERKQDTGEFMRQFQKVSDMTTGNPSGLMIRFAVPLFIGNVFQMLYSAVDASVVGKFVGPTALASVGAATPGYNLISTLIIGFTGGASIVISQAFGSGKTEETKKSFATSAILIAVTGLIFTIVGFLAAVPILRVMGTPKDTMDGAKTYLMWMCAGILATCLYNGMSSFLRAIGNSMTPLIALVLSSLLNVILDLTFVIAFHMGIAGVAIATVLSQLISGIYCVIYVHRSLPEYILHRSDLQIHKDQLKEMLRLGFPSALSSGVVTLSVMFIQRAVNAYGSTVMASYTAANKAEQIGFCLSYSIGLAVGVFAAQNKGAGKMDRVKEGLFTGIRISLIYHCIVAVFMYAGAGLLMRIFSSDPEVLDLGVHIVHITAVFGPVLGVVFIFQNFLRNVSDITPTIWMSGAEIFSRGFLPFALSSRFGYNGIWWATPIGWSLSMLIGVLRYRSGKWMKK